MHTGIGLRGKNTTADLAKHYIERVSGSDNLSERRANCSTDLLDDVKRLADVTSSKPTAGAQQFCPGVPIAARPLHASTV